MEKEKDVSCLSLVDNVFKCCSVGHQFGLVYRESRFDNCTDYFDDLKNCMMAKTVTNSEKQKVSY